MISETHRILVEALESRSYKRLHVNRFGQTCCLIVTLGDQKRVFVNKLGKPVEYRHVWQVRDWLQKRFAIPASEVEVGVVRQ